MKFDYLKLAEIIKTRRNELGISTRKLAEKIGTSHAEISRFENGEDISLSNFLKLMRALDLGERMTDMIPDQSKRPSYYLEKESKRSRASSTRDNRDSAPFVWGDEK